MRKSQVVFKISDVFNHPLRNYKRYPGVYSIKNIIYDTRCDSKNMLDIYLSPEKKQGKLPVFFNIHGGGYVGGGRRYRSGIAKYFADKGWAAINIGYRLAPKWQFPAATEDCINALNFVNGLAEEYDLDTEKIVIVGDSAGAYYAAHTVAAVFSDELREKLNLPEYTGAKPRALMGFYAPYDLMKTLQMPQPLNTHIDLINCIFGTEMKKEIDLSQMPYEDEVINVLKNVNSNWCETFIIEAERDIFVGKQAEDMGAALEAAGVKHHIYIASEKTAGHCTHLYPFLKSTKALQETIDNFMDGIKNE
ncbi:MAG TPA: alpha/beta hydrolase [Clostridia bacterium]|nr:alpha/beta hydrolase [Clostridia bacterium]